MSEARDRREELIQAADAIQQELYAVRIRQLEAEYGRPEYQEAMQSVVGELFRLWDETYGGRIGSMGICYLYSNILMRSYEFQLTLYGEAFYLDKQVVHGAWKPPCFFEVFEQDMEIIMDRLRKRYPRIYPYEEEAVRAWCVEYYLAAVYKLCADRMEGIVRETGHREDGFFVFYGRYGGEGEILFQPGAHEADGIPND